MLTEIGLQATEFLKKSKAKTLLPVHFLAALLQFDYIKNLLNNKKSCKSIHQSKTLIYQYPL